MQEENRNSDRPHHASNNNDGARIFMYNVGINRLIALSTARVDTDSHQYLKEVKELKSHIADFERESENLKKSLQGDK